MNILNDLEQAIAISKADIVLAENLDRAMGAIQKRKAADLLLSFRSQLEQAAIFIGREIYPVNLEKNRTVKHTEYATSQANINLKHGGDNL